MLAQKQSELDKIMHNSLQNVTEQYRELELTVNLNKSNLMTLTNNIRDKTTQTVEMEKSLLQSTEHVKFLGMEIDKYLNFDKHIDKVCNKLCSGIYILRTLNKLLNEQDRTSIYYGVIYPHLTYGILIWGGTYTAHVDRVFTLQKQAIRTIFKMKRNESCRTLF